MRVEVCMPRLGQSMEEGRVLRWLKSVGDRVSRGEVIAEIETDKAAAEMESTVSGILLQLAVAEGDLVPIGTPIAVVDDGKPAGKTEEGAEGVEGIPPSLGEHTKPSLSGPQPAEERGAEPTRVRASLSRKDFHKGETAETPPGHGGEQSIIATTRLNVSPVARQLAEQHGLDLSLIEGTGPDGRIVRADVEAWLGAQRLASQEGGEADDVTQVELPKIKLTAARRMSDSKASIPHFYVTADIGMDQALALRASFKTREIDISINDLILRATTLALLKFPHLNARHAGDNLLVHSHVHLSVAVALEEGLITPVIHNCETLSLAQLAIASRGIVERARSGRLRVGDLEEGTFTVTNLGPFGVASFHAIVNPPQAAILAVGAVRRVAVFDAGDRLVPAQKISATVSADHRVTDGAEVARFLEELKRVLEDARELA